MYLFLVDDISEHKKAKDVNKNGVATRSHGELKYILFNKKYLTHSLNRIQSKDQRIVTYETNTISMSCLDDKTYILNYGYDGLAFPY